MKELEDGHYLLTDGAAWFTVKGFSVRIHSTDEGVVVDMFADGKELGPPVAATYAFDHELTDLS
jgi:hypothetical protein